MGTWILILTLFTSTGNGVTVTMVPGFYSQAACAEAGRAWVVSLLNAGTPRVACLFRNVNG